MPATLLLSRSKDHHFHLSRSKCGFFLTTGWCSKTKNPTWQKVGEAKRLLQDSRTIWWFLKIVAPVWWYTKIDYFSHCSLCLGVRSSRSLFSLLLVFSRRHMCCWIMWVKANMKTSGVSSHDSPFGYSWDSHTVAQSLALPCAGRPSRVHGDAVGAETNRRHAGNMFSFPSLTASWTSHQEEQLEQQCQLATGCHRFPPVHYELGDRLASFAIVSMRSVVCLVILHSVAPIFFCLENFDCRLKCEN